MDEILGVIRKTIRPQEKTEPQYQWGPPQPRLAQHTVTFASSPYVPTVQPLINLLLDAGQKNYLYKLKVRIDNSMHFFSGRQFTLILLIYLSKSIVSIL